jgi:hypothetical protein
MDVEQFERAVVQTAPCFGLDRPDDGALTVQPSVITQARVQRHGTVEPQQKPRRAIVDLPRMAWRFIRGDHWLSMVHMVI